MKRRYPFEESTCHQLKYHIGYKEVNGGVNAGDRMQAVYDKTLSLLFRGANKSKNGCVVSEQSKLCTRLELQINSTPRPRQMKLQWSPSGHLHLNGRNNNGSEPSTSWTGVSFFSKCASCQNTTSELNKTCEFCENIVCPSCLCNCHICQKDFCQLCAVPTYTHQEEMGICLSCL